MLLAIDVGNTNIVIGVFRGDALVHSWRLTTIRERTSDELGILITDLCDRYQIAHSEITGIVIASVVPPLTGSTPRWGAATSIPKSAPTASSTASRRMPRMAPAGRSS